MKSHLELFLLQGATSSDNGVKISNSPTNHQIQIRAFIYHINNGILNFESYLFRFSIIIVGFYGLESKKWISSKKRKLTQANFSFMAAICE